MVTKEQLEKNLPTILKWLRQITFLKFLVVIVFTMWCLTEFKQEWFGISNADLMMKVQETLTQLKETDAIQNTAHENFIADHEAFDEKDRNHELMFIGASNTLERLDEKLDRELQILRRDVDRNTDHIDRLERGDQ